MATTDTNASVERELVITRVFDAPRELVFSAWTDPHHLGRWFGPKHHPAIQVNIDVRPDGAWRAHLRSTGTDPDLWVGGVYREIVKPERLVFTFAWEEEGERGLETVVSMTFEKQGDKTRMTMRQAPFQSDEQRDGHDHGWNSTFDRLAELLPSVTG